MSDEPRKFNWPRARDLPEAERQPFLDFLHKGLLSTPHLEGELPEDQDGYYHVDLDNFRKIPPTRYWD